MRIAVVGATGGTGAHAVAQALGHGHEVTAVVRDPSRVTQTHERLTVATADVLDLDSVRAALPGHDAVLSAIGGKPGGSVDVYSKGIESILYAMAENDISRLVAMSASGAFHRNDKNLSLGYRLLMKAAMSGLYDDLERMEQRIMASSLSWVIVRPAGLTDAEQTGHYRIGLDGRPLGQGGRISRADVAAFMLKSAETDQWVRKAITLAY